MARNPLNPPKSEKKSWSFTKIHFLIQTPEVHLSLFLHFGQKWGLVSEGPQGGSQSCKTPRNPLFVVLYVGKNIYLGGCLKRQGFPSWSTHVIYAAAALAGDDSPGRFSRPIVHWDDALSMCLPG